MNNTKTLGNTFLYTKFNDYEKTLFNFIMNAEVVDKANESFNDLKYEIRKHQISNSLVKVLASNNVLLLIGQKQLPKAFKVFAAKDIKGDRKMKVFIDCTGVINYSDNKYVCVEPSILISYLVNAMMTLIYHADSNRIRMNSGIVENGARCFSSLFVYILDYIYKINSMSNIRDKAIYLATMYYQVNILGKDQDSDSVEGLAKKLSGLSEREQDIIRIQYDENTFDNIKFFIEACSKILKLDRLTLDIFIERWMYSFGTGTLFALELFPQFSAMITDAYVGAYLNNQKQIEKIASKNMVTYTKNILSVGAESL